MNKQTHYDLIGVGIGPFNLSIAALAATQAQLSSMFFEKKPHFAWHPGLLLQDSKMQTSFMKDLVSCVDPTSPYSFMNYLVRNRKVYPFLASGQAVISRLEFSDYMGWVAHQLHNTRFDSKVEEVYFEGDRFVVRSGAQRFYSRHLVMGTGMQPYLPGCAEPFVGSSCFHASKLVLQHPDLRNKRVAIIGGGQTGADVFQHVFDGKYGKPARLDWISRRPNIEALDEACFTDEYFMPNYVKSFYHLEQNRKDREVSRQKLTSDGITNQCLQDLYQRLYHDKYVLKNPAWWSIQPSQTLTAMSRSEQGYSLQLRHGLDGAHRVLEADAVVLCTGFKRALPPCLAQLMPDIETDSSGQVILSEDFCTNWQGSKSNRIYMVNAGMRSHGIAEPQLSLTSWRAATIINHVMARQVYDLTEQDHILDWGLPTTGYRQALTDDEPRAVSEQWPDAG